MRLWVVLLISGLAVVGIAGQAVGPVIIRAITGSTGITAGQAVVIDRDNLTDKDVRKAIADKVVTFNDEGTSLTVAAELQTGQEFVLDVPLANLSDADASVIATLEAFPELRKNIELFWRTQTRSTTPGAQTTDPAPAPVTGTSPQTSDTAPAAVPPPGVAGIDAQMADTTGTTSSPGLPAAGAQTQPGNATTTQPSGVQDNTAQAAGNTSITNNPADVPGSAGIAARTAPSTSTTTEPDGLAGLAGSRIVNFTPVTASPNGTPGVTAQVVNAASGQFSVDTGADGVTDASGTCDVIDLSSDDNTFSETIGGPLDNAMTGPDDDERAAGGASVRLGAFYTFVVQFAADGSSARITASTWCAATVAGTDLDGDAAADDTFYAAITDIDSDGLYDRLDLSAGDNTFGETAGGTISVGIVDYAADNTNDERLSNAAFVKLGVNTFHFSFSTHPGAP